MDYIILDLEWDSAYFPKYKRFINQILQIGAVKLNGDFDIIDTFEATIKSSISKKVSNRFSTLTGITSKMMLSGVGFEDAVKEYNSWAGTDTVTMTWSNSDLYSIIENQKFLLKDTKFNLDKYLDLQKYIQNEMLMLGFELNSQISLANAAQLMGINTDGFDLHTAKDDSLICAKLLKRCFCKERFLAFVCDTAEPGFYERLCFKPFYIADITDSKIDKKQLNFTCPDCGEVIRRTAKWRFNRRWFISEFKCKACSKKFSARVSFKKTYDDVMVKRRICEVENKKEDAKNDMQSVSAAVQL